MLFVVRHLSVSDEEAAAGLTLKTSAESANYSFVTKRIRGAAGHSGGQILKGIVGTGRGKEKTEGELNFPRRTRVQEGITNPTNEEDEK